MLFNRRQLIELAILRLKIGEVRSGAHWLTRRALGLGFQTHADRENLEPPKTLGVAPHDIGGGGDDGDSGDDGDDTAMKTDQRQTMFARADRNLSARPDPHVRQAEGSLPIPFRWLLNGR